jgi:hypothetical protein
MISRKYFPAEVRQSRMYHMPKNVALLTEICFHKQILFVLGSAYRTESNILKTFFRVVVPKPEPTMDIKPEP